MQRVGEFKKVSFQQFKTAVQGIFNLPDTAIQSIYDNIILPNRATNGSAGYDFYTPFNISLSPKQNILIPSGIRVKIDNGWFLGMVPKSGLGFKYRLQLDNTMGIIDSDYYNSDNEGHIFIKLTNDTNSDKSIAIKAGQAVCQGIFFPFGITINDNAQGMRNGGFGSTAK